MWKTAGDEFIPVRDEKEKPDSDGNVQIAFNSEVDKSLEGADGPQYPYPNIGAKNVSSQFSANTCR